MPWRFELAPAIWPYQRQWLRGDVLAGLAAGAVVIPQAMAYATVAGMPVQFGLYTCMLPLVVYAFIGGSRTASMSTTSTVATLTASTMLGAGIVAGSPDAASELITLTLLVGVILLAARLVKLGSIVENINRATLIGLKAGVGLTIVASQLPKLLGVAPDPNHDGFFRVLWSALSQVGDAHVVTVGLTVVSIAILILMGYATPRIPGPLVIAALGIVAAAFGGLSSMGVKLIPAVPQGLPIPGWPAFDHVAQLIPGALAIAMMAFLETVSAARGIRRSEDPQLDPDRELTARGLAAVLGSFFHTLPPSAGFSQLPAVAVGMLLTLYAVLHEANHPHVVQVVRRDGSYWVDRAEGDPIEPADPLVLRAQVALYTANLRANANVVSGLVKACDPRPKTLVLDLSRQPKVSSTILDGLRELDTEMAGLGVAWCSQNCRTRHAKPRGAGRGGKSLQHRAGTQPR